ncbi:MAG: hypothetical protein KC729_16880 [Candidatus Eisenbacteria bacterium]|uniref:Uncharacterized protein n=1 Tax=Eiseniibacteriota bacterium TaxID=2212470 RepID=A0A956M3W2_UNCEI|nr:hypothetical protein [Candidatus Eisenbacteria bacterium]
MFLRLRLPLFLTFFAGLIPIVAFFFKEEATIVKLPSNWLEQDMVIVSGFALLLGVVNVVQTNVRKIERRDNGWPFALVLLLGIAFMGIFGAAGALRLGGLPGIGNYPDGRLTPFAWGSRYMFTPLQSTMFSLLAFYIASAAFRAFRVRNLEATILLLAAVLVMLGRIPVGEGVFGGVTEWMMQVPNGAAQRGIIIGAALGAASLSLRVILGIERSYLGLDKNG